MAKFIGYHTSFARKTGRTIPIGRAEDGLGMEGEEEERTEAGSCGETVVFFNEPMVFFILYPMNEDEKWWYVMTWYDSHDLCVCILCFVVSWCFITFHESHVPSWSLNSLQEPEDEADGRLKQMKGKSFWPPGTGNGTFLPGRPAHLSKSIDAIEIAWNKPCDRGI